MAHLWVRDRDSGEWAVVPLGREPLMLGDWILPTAGWFHLPADARRSRLRIDRRPEDDMPVASIVWSMQDGRDSWALIATPWHVRLNGVMNAPGLRALQDRDEIRIGGFEKFYFSMERLAVVEPCPPSERALACPRCRQPIEPGVEAVCCPGCGVWHHETAALPCWTYAERCALCPQDSSLDVGYQWTPELL